MAGFRVLVGLVSRVSLSGWAAGAGLTSRQWAAAAAAAARVSRSLSIIPRIRNSETETEIKQGALNVLWR